MHLKSTLRVLSLSAVVSAGLMLTGCVTMPPLTAPIRSRPEPLPVGEKLPLRVGLLISEAALGYQYHAKVPMGEWIYPFGKDLPEVARQTFLQVFDGVALVQSPDFQSYDLIIAPAFDDAATHVDISFSTIRVAVGLTFEVMDASGVKWRKSFVGDLTTGGRREDQESHGQAVSKAVSAAAVAMRSEFASARPKAGASAAAPAAAAWWAK